MKENWPAPVEVGSLPHYLQAFFTSFLWLLGISEPPTVAYSTSYAPATEAERDQILTRFGVNVRCTNFFYFIRSFYLGLIIFQ